MNGLSNEIKIFFIHHGDTNTMSLSGNMLKYCRCDGMMSFCSLDVTANVQASPRLLSLKYSSANLKTRIGGLRMLRVSPLSRVNSQGKESKL